MNRILVIRGGAIGDFILTLPALKLLRDQFPDAQIEILGNTRITVLAENRFYANRIHSIEDRALASFFVGDGRLPAQFRDYFRSFNLILSYLFDPDAIFRNNLERCGIQKFLAGPAKLNSDVHAAIQLARPLEGLGLNLVDPAARLYPSEQDRRFAREFFGQSNEQVVALHPGSGSESKNWPIENWKALGDHLFSANRGVLLIGGEADEKRLQFLEAAWKDKPVRLARNLALPALAALLERCVFVGHDSGISHLAAAAGVQSILMFGQTDPAVWAPTNKNVTVLQAPAGNLRLLAVNHVTEALVGSGQDLQELQD
jgi:heptosyltransferase-3